MCGIAGYFSLKGMSDAKGILNRMSVSLRHRGPDDKGIWFDGNIGIGFAHRRLSIIDVSEQGVQPMVSHTGRFVICYNGEVYNFKELRRELDSKNIKWRGTSDTEVLLAGFETWGVETTLVKLNGMFAFVLWDKKKKILYLARDPLGKKPLYYGFNNGIFFFASELKALKTHPEFKPAIDRNVLPLLLRHSYIPTPYSIYHGIKKLLPGSFCSVGVKEVKEKQAPKPRQFWDLETVALQGISSPLSGPIENVTDQLEKVLSDAVSRRMISDVPLGAFLSGGIDSSLIVALMQKISDKPVKTFSIGFDETGYNEADSAKQVARILGTDHTELYVTPQQAIDVIPQLPVLFDEPFADSSQIPTFLVSKMTRKYVTVALSGDGGDEMFAGYNRHFWGRYLWEKLENKPVILKKIFKGVINSFSPSTWNSIFSRLNFVLPKAMKQTMPGDKLAKLSSVLASENKKEFYYNLTSWWQRTDTLVKEAKEPRTLLNSFSKWPDIEDFTQLMQFMDMKTYLTDDILTKVDRSSMGASLEARAPLLDREVLRFSWKIPLEMKIQPHSGKIILKKMLARYLPEYIFDRPKSGFGLPLDQWLRSDLSDWANDLLSADRLRKQDYFNVGAVKKAWNDHLAGKCNMQYHLWNILMFQAWLENEKL